MVGLQTLDLAIGVRVPASQPKIHSRKTNGQPVGRPFSIRKCATSHSQRHHTGRAATGATLDRFFRDARYFPTPCLTSLMIGLRLAAINLAQVRLFICGM